MKSVFALIFTFTSSLLLISCSDTDGDRGRLSISLTDGPVEADKVVIHFTGATIQPATGDRIDVIVTDPDDNQITGRSIDLLEYTGDKSTVLFNEQLPTGQYSWIRLDVDFDPLKTYIQTPDGGQHALSCNSCENNGLKLNRNFDIAVVQTTAFTLDFELAKSITEANGVYKLRPTIRIIETVGAGEINGNVDPTLTASIGGPDGCSVYVFEGSDITPNDIYIPETGDTPADHNNPVSTAVVDVTTDTYTSAFLPAGDYTVSLTCDAELDAAELDDDLNFTGTTNISVLTGLVSNVDFPAP